MKKKRCFEGCLATKWALVSVSVLGLYGGFAKSLFAQIVGRTARSLGDPQKVQHFFDSSAFFLIKTVGVVVGITALAIAIFAAKFGRGSFGNIASVCLYIALLFLAPSIVQLLAMFTGVGYV